MTSRIVVLISGSGTNLQAIIDACKSPQYPGEVVGVISNKADVYGLTRAENAKIPAATLSHKAFDSREAYDRALEPKSLSVLPITHFEPYQDPWLSKAAGLAIEWFQDYL